MELNRKNLNEEDLEKEFIWKLVIGDIVSAKNLFPAVNNEEIINFAIKNRICIQLLNFIYSEGLEKYVKSINLSNLENIAKKYASKTLETKKNGLNFLKILTEKNISYVALKGFSLLPEINPKDRIIRDLDILVEKDHIASVANLALKNNFRFKNHKSYAESMVDSLSRYYDLPNMIDESGVCLEIHFRIDANQKKIPCSISALMLQEGTSKNFKDTKISISSMEMNIIGILFHASIKGNFDSGIQVITDLVSIVKTKKINYFELHAHIKQLGYENEFSPFFHLLKIEGIEDIPEFLVEKSSVRKAFLLKEILLMTPINIKLSKIFSSANFKELVSNIHENLFVRKSEIQREFGSKQYNPIFYFNYLRRWARQINQFFLRSIKLVVDNNRSRRNTLIKEFFDNASN